MKGFQLFICIIAVAMMSIVSGTAFGVNIAWVSFHGATDDGLSESAGAAGVGFTEAPDKGYTDFLAAAGHTINRVLSIDPATNAAIPPAVLAELNAADLVIVGRSNDSAAYGAAAESMSWNVDVTKPLILTSGFVSRGGTGGGLRLGYTTGETTADLTAPQALTAQLPGHPIFAGVTLDGSNQTGTTHNIVTAPINGNPAVQRGASLNTNAPVTGGTVLARITAGGAPAGEEVIVEYPAGTLSSQGHAFGNKRMLFITGSREVDGISTQTAGILDLTPVGQQIFLNAVSYLTTVFINGDTNGNGTGGEYPADFNPIRDNFRKSPRSRAQGDLTGNGVVDFDDFRQWKAAAVGSGTSLEGLDLGFLGTVPEPGSLTLLAITTLSIVSAARVRRSPRQATLWTC